MKKFTYWPEMIPLALLVALLASVAISFAGCGEASNTVTYETPDGNVTFTEGYVTVPDGESIVLENDQTIGYKPNTDVTIIQVGDGSYYVQCNDGSECPVYIGNVDDNDNSTNDSNNDNSTNDNSATYVESNISE